MPKLSRVRVAAGLGSVGLRRWRQVSICLASMFGNSREPILVANHWEIAPASLILLGPPM